MTLPDQSAALPSDQPVRTRLAAIALAIIAGLLCSPASAADAVSSGPPGYPASGERGDVLTWLSAHTSVRPGDVVVISPQAVVSLDGVTRTADKTAPIDAIVREELIDVALAERTHARSTRVLVQLDCAASMFRIRENARFALPDLKGDAVKKTSTADWTRLEDGTVMVQVAHAACATGAPVPVVQAASGVTPPPVSKALASPATTTKAEAPRMSAPTVASNAAAPAPKISAAATLAKADAPRAGAPPAPTPAVASRPSPSEPSYWILLGSYSNKDNAHVAVARLTRGNPGPVKGRDVVVHKASVNGREYFFVAVEGFAQRADASGFCKAVHAAPEACLIHH